MPLLLAALLLTALPDDPAPLKLRAEGADAIAFVREGHKDPLLVFHAPADGRPYTHPITAPDGQGVLTEFSPGHHKHQTGLYVGFLKVNGRDFFHNRGADHYARVTPADTRSPVEDATATGHDARWSTRYRWLDAAGGTLLTETQRWHLHDAGDHYRLDLTWTGTAGAADVTFGQHDYGGLFLRMPWTAATGGTAVNSAGQTNRDAEGQRADWVEVAVPIPGRDPNSPGRIAILDHPGNPRHPATWRVDDQLGIGPAPSRPGDWTIPAGQSVTLRYRLVIGTGDANRDRITKAAETFAASAKP